MPVRQEDHQEYLEFAGKLLKELGSLKFDPETVLWHYTSGSALLSIITSGTIYSTQVSCLNDSTEISYGSKLLQAALTELSAKYKNDERLSLFFPEIIKYLADEPDVPANSSLPYFVTCFSLEGDDLSQWRSYCNGENGYAIGFRANGFFGINSSIVAKVDYCRANHERLAMQVAEATVRFFLDGLEKERAGSITQWTGEFLPAWDGIITQLAPLIKDPSFASEKEFRIVHQLVPGELPNIRVLQKGTMMSRHLPLKTVGTTTVPTLPVVGVRVGPCRHPAITRVSVDTALRQMGYSGGLVSSSQIPFRQT